MPAVSVVMPVYNALPHLREAVDSLLAQDYDDIEILALDDMSTDGSGAYLDGVRDCRLRVLHCPRQGLTRLLNLGLRLARGPLVARMDADDISLRHRLSAQRAFMEDHPEVVALGCQAQYIDQNGNLEDLWEFPLNDLPTKLLLFSNATSFAHPGVMYRRDDVLAIGGYDESLRFAQDRDLWWRLADVGQFCNYPEILIKYRRHVLSISGGRSQEQLQTALAITKKYVQQWDITYEQIERFIRYEIFMHGYQREGLTTDGVANYVVVLNKILSQAPQRWNVDLGAIEQIRLERWNYLFWWLRKNRLPLGEHLRYLRCLHDLSPAEMRPNRLALRLIRKFARISPHPASG